MRAAAIAFLGGILLVQQLADLPSLGWALALVPLLLLSFRHPRWLVPAFFVAGVVWAGWRADLILTQQLPETLEGSDLVLEGVVAELPQAAEYGVRFRFDVQRAYVDGAPAVVPSRVLLSADRELEPQAGDRLRLVARLKRPHGLQNPGGFDYEAYLFRNRIRATGHVRAKPAAERLGAAGGMYRIDRWRQQLGTHMRALMPSNPYAGLMVALANGDGAGVGDEQWDTLARTGTLHLVAISGMHISLIAGLVMLLVRWLWSWPALTVLRLPAPLAGAAAGLMAATMYAALAGFVIPTQRALVMLAITLGAVLLRKRVAPSYLLALALVAVLILDPLSVMAPGFWLSFAAVAVIVYVMYSDAGSWWRKLGYLQWAVAVGMLPLTLWLFQRLSLVAPAANLAAVPVFDFLVVPLTLLGVLFIGVGADVVAAWLFRLGGLLLEGLWRLLDVLAHFDYAQWSQHQPSAWALACGLVGVLLLLAPRGWPGRWIGVVWLLPLFVVRPAGPAAGEVWFTLLDVGQGLSAVVRTQSHVLVFDTGARRGARFDMGNAVVVPALRAAGIDRIDTLLVSHGDNDHAGGATSVRTAMAVGRLVSGAPEIAGEACRAGDRWRWDGVTFSVLNPVDGGDVHENDGSCVLRVEGRYGAILLPGDIEKRAERRLVEQARASLAADILVAPHHGSRTSSTPEFLRAVHPRYVLFPVGYRNSYHHPHPTVVERYHALGAVLADSPSGGALEFRLRPAGIEWRGYRESHRRYWHAR